MEIYPCAYLSLLIAYLRMIYEPFIVNGVIIVITHFKAKIQVDKSTA